MSPSKGKVAHVEDYDSDASAAVSGTRVKAKRPRATTSAPPVSMDRHRGKHRSTNSDSGYSSHTTGTQESKASADAKAMPPPARPASSHPSAKKPVLLQRTSSQRNSQSAPQRSPTKSAQSKACNCGDPKCPALAQNMVQRTSTDQYAVQYPPPSPYAPSPGGQYPLQYAYNYQNPQAPSTQVPMLSQPYPPARSTSQQRRPASFHGGLPYQIPSQGGPPPSASAYHTLAYNTAQQQPYAYGGVYGSTPSDPISYPTYMMQASPVASSPIAANNAPVQGLQRRVSARSNETTSAAGIVGRSQSRPIQSARVNTTPQNSARSRMPGEFPGQETSESDTSSESDSESEYSSEEIEPPRRLQRDSRLMSSSSQRRPSLKGRAVTDSAAHAPPARQILPRYGRSDYGLEDILSSDNMDSDKTTRAVAGRSRTLYTNSSKSSRRPSVSTNASSGHTRTTAPSSITGSNVVVEDRKGRRISYLSQNDREAYVRQQLQAQSLGEQHRRREDDVEAYQNQVRGSREPSALSLEQLRRQQARASGSHMAHDRKSSRSSSKAGGGDGFMIGYGGTMLHVYGDATIEVQPAEDGGPGRMVIGGGTKDRSYHGGSKSSGSRVGRSRGGSERGSRRRESQVREREDEYEPRL